MPAPNYPAFEAEVQYLPVVQVGLEDDENPPRLVDAAVVARTMIAGRDTACLVVLDRGSARAWEDPDDPTHATTRDAVGQIIRRKFDSLEA